MAAVTPIKSKQLKLAAKWISKQAPYYQAIYHIGTGSGFRTSDICRLRWSNVNLDKGTVSIEESKGTLASKARARLKVLTDFKNELIAMHTGDTAKMMQIFITKPKDIYPLAKSLLAASCVAALDARIEQAKKNAPVKSRTAKLSPNAILALRKLKDKHTVGGAYLGGDSIFAKCIVSDSNRAVGCEGVLSRQSVYRLYKRLQQHLESIGEAIGKLGAHSGRKTAALMLYVSSGHNIGLVMQVMGWSSEQMVLRYLGLNNDDSDAAFEKAFELAA